MICWIAPQHIHHGMAWYPNCPHEDALLPLALIAPDMS
jgi:hypothetical protein